MSSSVRAFHHHSRAPISTAVRRKWYEQRIHSYLYSKKFGKFFVSWRAGRTIPHIGLIWRFGHVDLLMYSLCDDGIKKVASHTCSRMSYRGGRTRLLYVFVMKTRAKGTPGVEPCITYETVYFRLLWKPTSDGNILHLWWSPVECSGQNKCR